MSNNKELKLNNKRTLIIGAAFFSILMLWQVYNHYCPLLLEELLKQKFEGKQLTYIIGIIMACDNILSIFMLPLFGRLSDKTKSKYGKRMPYIVVGMVSAAIVFPFIPVMFMINNLVGTIIMMLAVLLIMNMYRNPAVALMPDVTPKPLRSKANGLINFVGYLGAILAGGLAMILPFTKTINENKELFPYNVLIVFIVASVFMIAAVSLLIFKINENKILAETKEDMELGEKYAETFEEIKEDKPLSKGDKKNIFILLLSVFFWFMSFNAIETFNGLFCKDILGSDGIGGTFTIILTVTSILTFLGTLNWPSKHGRKKCVIFGLISIIFGFLGCTFYIAILGGFGAQSATPEAWPFFIFSAYCGFGWALINANSYPMLMEVSSSKNIGTYTGRYYTFSMLAQSITPVLVGLIMTFNAAGLKLLYVYSSITMIIAFIIFILFKETRKPIKETKKGFEALE